MEPLGARARIGLFAHERAQFDRLFEMREHGSEPDVFPIAPHAIGSAVEFQKQQPGRQVPEPCRVQPRRDISPKGRADI